MKDEMKCAILILIVLVLIWLLRGTKSSNYTYEPFDAMTNVQEVTASFKAQSQKIGDDLKAELEQARTDKKTKEEMIVITDKYNDYSCELTKAFSRWNINKLTI
jgi:cell shape-determining protein MreC